MLAWFFCSSLFRISVLVGAPKANTSQPGVVEAGAVYYCPWPGAPDSCRQIPFDNSSELPENTFADQNELLKDFLRDPPPGFKHVL